MGKKLFSKVYVNEKCRYYNLMTAEQLVFDDVDNKGHINAYHYENIPVAEFCNYYNDYDFCIIMIMISAVRNVKSATIKRSQPINWLAFLSNKVYGYLNCHTYLIIIDAKSE